MQLLFFGMRSLKFAGWNQITLLLLDPIESTKTFHSFQRCNPETLWFSSKMLITRAE